MGVLTFTETNTSAVSAARLFKGWVVDAPNLLPKIVPEVVQNFELIEGNGGPGSIVQVNFVEANSPIKNMKFKIDVVDNDNLTYVDTVILEHDKIESIIRELKFESTPDGGSIVKSIAKINTKPGAEISEEEVKPSKDLVSSGFKALEAYFLANPDA